MSQLIHWGWLFHLARVVMLYALDNGLQPGKPVHQLSVCCLTAAPRGSASSGRVHAVGREPDAIGAWPLAIAFDLAIATSFAGSWDD